MIIVWTMIFLLTSTGLVLAGMHQEDKKQMQENMQRMHPSEEQMEWFCPWCGADRDGGMDHRRLQKHGWCRGECPKEKSQDMAPLGKDDVRMLMKNYVSANPNLKAGDITEKDDVYVGEIVTKDGSLVEKVVIDKQTGWMKYTY